MSTLKRKLSLLSVFIFIILALIFYKAIQQKNEEERKMTFYRCINFVNDFEDSKENKFNMDMGAGYFDIIKKAGFDSVRLPVRFSDYVNKNTYILDKEFMSEIDYYIDYALQYDLTLILDFHNFSEIMDEPEKYKEMFISIWNQISERYEGYSDKLIFELLSEPRDNLRGSLWNDYLKEGIDIIRKHDKLRKIIVGPDSYYSIDRLYDLVTPKDKNLILTFHYYEPINFTFQGSQYHDEYKKLKNIKWIETEKNMDILNNNFDIAKKYSMENKIPVFLGEFGVNRSVEEPYRANWIRAVRKEAENYNFSWSYCDFCSDFGIYDLEKQEWSVELQSLIPK